MATFTMTFKEALERDPEIRTGILATYPLFDESHRGELNQKIIDHYWNQEIGQETVSMFRLALRRKLNEIMPLYNQQYEISAIKFNQLETVRVSNAGTSKSDSTSDAKSRVVAQQYPQTRLAGNADYATNGQDTVSETAATGESNDTSTVAQRGTGDNVTTGFQGNAAMMILQYRQSLVNVDMMIIDELNELFMLIWSNGDEFTERNYGSYAYIY
jgi:hypothetical protein